MTDPGRHTESATLRGAALFCSTIGRSVALVLPGLLAPASALGLDHVAFERDAKRFYVEGRVLVTAQDDGLLLLARDGVIWAIPPEERIRHTRDPLPFSPLTADELSEQLLAELPSSFKAHRTAHYLVLYDTSTAYAEWCGSLFERLYMAFTNYFGRRGVELKEPEFPLVATIFADRQAYLKCTRAELGGAGESIIGYFSLRTNRMTMYDLTGVERLRLPAGRGNASQIGRILAQPQAQQQVATIVHEATHQIAFNCGLHTRYSDCPLWFSEGIAVYFETPDLSSSRGWRGIGAVNRPRLVQFQQYLRHRPTDSLRTLIATDQRFRDPKRALDAYAEAWALTYFLIRRHSDAYAGYLQQLSKKKPLLEDDAQTRIKQFEAAFGNLEQLDREMVRYILRNTGR